MDPLDRLIQDLAAEGRLDSRGEFSLDGTKAREKLRRFQLAAPGLYLSELVQGAVLRGARRIDFDVDTDDVRMRFDGSPLDAAEWRELFPSLFTTSTDPLTAGRRHLAMGINGALGNRPRFVRVHSVGEDGAGIAVELHPDRPEAVSRLHGEAPGTRIHVRDRLRPALLGELWRHLGGGTDRERLLRDRCRYSRIPVYVQGERVSRGLALPEHDPRIEVDGEGVRGLAGFDREATTRGTIVFLANGVVIARETVELGPLGFLAVIEAPGITTNVAESGVVRDAAHAAAITAVLAAREGAVAALCRELLSPHPAPAREALLRAALRREALSFTSVEPFRSDPDRYPGILARPGLWPDAIDGARRVALADLIAIADRGERVDYVNDEVPDLAGDEPRPPIPVLQRVEERRLLRRLFGKSARNATRQLRQQALSAQARERWRSRPALPVLGDGLFLVRLPISGEGLRGEAGIRDLSRPVLVSSWIKDGCLLLREERPFPVPGCEVVVEADFTPKQRWDGVHRDAVLAKALCALARALPALFAAAAPSGSSVAEEETTTAAAYRDLLALLARPDYPVGVLTAGGFAPTSASRHVEAASREEPFSRPDLGRTGSGALATVRCYPTLGGALRSLADLHGAEEVRILLEEEVARIVPISDRSRRLQAARDLAPEAADALVVGRRDRETLAAFLAPRSLADASPALRFAAGRQRHREKPTTPLELPGAVVEATVSAPGIVGAVGLLPPWTTPGEASGSAPGSVAVRLLIEQRTIAERAFPAPFGRWAGVVAAPSLRPCEDWSDVVDDQAVDAVRKAVATAALTALSTLPAAFEGLRGPRREALRRSLLQWLAPRAAELRGGRGGPTPAAVAIRGLPLFPRPDGSHADLAEVESQLADRGRLDLVQPGPELPLSAVPELAPGRPLLLAGEEEVALLGNLFGYPTLHDASDELRSARRRRRLERRPEVSELALAPGDALVHVVVERDGVRGEVGLAAEHGGASSPSFLRLCKGRRYLGAYHWQLPAVLTAIVDDERLALDPELGCDLGHPSFAQLLAVLEGCIAELLELLRERWPELDGRAREAAWHHVLDHLARSCRLDAGNILQIPTPLARLPGFTAVDGKLYSLADLARTYRRGGSITYALAPETAPLEHPDAIVLANPGAHERERLAAIFPRVLDGSDLWRQTLTRRRNRARAPALPDEPPALARVELSGALISGWLAVPTTPETPRGIALAADGRVLALVPAPAGFPCTGAVWGTAVEPSDSWSTASLSARGRAVVDRGARRLFRQLASNHRRRDHDAAWFEEATRALAAVALHLWRADLDGGAGDREGDQLLFEELRELRLFALASGERVSLRRALEERPRLVAALADGREPPGPPGRLPLSASPTPPLPVTAAPGLQRGSRAEASGLGETPPSPPASQPPRAEEAEARLLEELRGRLRWVQERRVPILAAHDLDRLHLGDEEPRVVASFGASGVALQRRHPVVRGALADPGDPVAVTLLASAVYTALNCRRPEVNDDDERRFHFLLADFLASASPAG